MAVDKNFVIKNGLEVSEDLLFADDITEKVGIGISNPSVKLDVIGDATITGFASVGLAVSSKDGMFTGIVSARDGLDVGLGGTALHVRTLSQKVGINSADPTYTTDLRGPVSTGTTALFVFGDVEVTGNIKCTELEGQITDGGTVGFSTVVVSDNLDAPASNVYGVFNVEDLSNDYNFVSGGNDPVAIGFTENTINPELFLMRGQKYHFNINASGFPFFIKTAQTTGIGNQYTDGVIGNGAEVGVVTFNVPYNSPDILFYQASNQAGMGGAITIVGVYTGTSEFLDITGIATIANADITNLNVTGFSTLAGAGASITFLEVVGMTTLGFATASGINVSGVVTATEFAGIATGSDKIEINQTNVSDFQQLTFVPQNATGYADISIDTQNAQLRYQPSTNILRVGIFSGDLHGTAQKATDVQIAQKNNNQVYQVGFTTANGTTPQRIFIDSDDTGLSYNPSTGTLQVTTLVGDVTGTATTATDINIANTSDTGNHFLVFTDGAANNSNQRPEVNNSLIFVPSTGQLTSTLFSGDGGGLTGLNATQLTIGKVPSDRGRIASSVNGGFLQFTGNTKDDGCLYGGTSNPSNTTRLNYDGQLHATGFTGPLTGNASSASQVFVDENDTETDGKLLFVSDTDSNQSVFGDGGLTYNSTTNLLTVVIGSVNASGDNNNFGNTTLDDVTCESLTVTGNTTLGDDASNTTSINGNLTVTGDITAFFSSDERLKDNITPIPDALDKVLSISGNTYNWKEDGTSDTGVIAQQVEALGLPGLVQTRENGDKAVAYDKLVPLLIEAVKELTERVKELEK